MIPIFRHKNEKTDGGYEMNQEEHKKVYKTRIKRKFRTIKNNEK